MGFAGMYRPCREKENVLRHLRNVKKCAAEAISPGDVTAEK